MNEKSNALLNIILGSAFFLALITGALYMLGYIYWEAFYAHFNIPLRMIEISKEQFVLYGSARLWILAFILSIAFLFLSAINLFKDFLKNKLPRWAETKLFLWLKKDLDNLPKIFHIAVSLFFLLILIIIIFLKFFDWGAKDGSQYALCSAPLVEVVYKDETVKVKKEHWGLLTISKGAYFFFELVNKAEETPNVIILQKESLVSITTTGKVKTKTNIESCKPPQTTNKTKSPCLF